MASEKKKKTSGKQKEVFAWMIVVFLGFVMILGWTIYFSNRLENIRGNLVPESFEPPPFQEQLKYQVPGMDYFSNMQDFNVPDQFKDKIPDEVMDEIEKGEMPEDLMNDINYE